MRALPALLPCLAAALQAPLRSRRLSTSLNILSPEAMVSLQKATNKAEFEDTVAKYAKQKRLSTREAELEYARYLLVAARRLFPNFGCRVPRPRESCDAIHVSDEYDPTPSPQGAAPHR